MAIALVAVFHVWFGRVSGGVDVFLVCPVSSSVARCYVPPWNPAPGFPGVGVRPVGAPPSGFGGGPGRCRGVLTVLIQPETRWETFAEQSLASLGYYQNWELAETASNYLRAGDAVSPLQHIWSMSVQGQFYVSFLILIAAVALLFGRLTSKRLRFLFVTLLTVLTVASFVYAIFAHQADQTTAYYNSFARAWELLLGALAGAAVPYVTWPMWLRNGLAGLGLIAVLSCGALIDGVREFPGSMGAGARRCRGAPHSGRGQPAGPPFDA